MLIDITRTLGSDSLCYPGDPDFEREEIAGDGYTIARLAMGSHSGTHLDAPRHLFPDGRTLESYDMSRFVLPVEVVSCGMANELTPEHLAGVDVPEGGGVLFRTANSFLARDVPAEDYVTIRPDTAQLLIERGVSLVGIDYISPDRSDSHDLPVHTILLRADVLILEDIDLSAVEPGRYRLSCLPLRVKNSDAAPCRAVLER